MKRKPLDFTRFRRHKSTSRLNLNDRLEAGRSGNSGPTFGLKATAKSLVQIALGPVMSPRIRLISNKRYSDRSSDPAFK